ncbi:alpha/beta hydrolase-fold protein [uncultured Kordia sp.]|uniref:alpha/beta hydrolase-fold protein n=1 Tax=uncultured Kordia sp. TaxID=507699 RepID=UPI002606D0E2|nr:alpha/beta hydrolase-fold protein [uncultured Kordia sp.]
MKKIIVVYFLCLFFYTVNGQNSTDIIIGKTDHVYSEILHEQRKIMVYVPENNPYDKNTYPVVYLLDGDAHFYSVVGMIRQLSSVNGNTICPKMIVVGISNTNRTRDLTPTKGEVENSGGGENFISFVEKELIPHIDTNYPTTTYRTFIGHSLGGLTVMNTLVNKPHLFNAYVAIDPSMWWNKKNLLNKIKSAEFNSKHNNKTLFLGIANTMSKGLNIKSVLKDTTSKTAHIRAILELNSYLETQTELSFKGKYYENDDHGSVPLITTYDALRYIFNFYRFKLKQEDYINPEIDILGKVENYYKRLSKGFGVEIRPDEGYVNSIGVILLRKKQFKKAAQFFNLNIKNYPESFNAYESIGDLYLATGNKEKAIKNYKKAISLNDDVFLKAKLLELEKK